MPRSARHAAFGRALREFRIAEQISQEELAHRAKLHRNYVGGIERGERNPSLTNILRLADGLNVRPSQLLAEMENLTSPAPPRQ